MPWGRHSGIMADGDVGMEDEIGPPQAVRIPLGNPPLVFAMPGSEDFVGKALKHLSWQPGICTFKCFENGEISVKLEQSVTSHDVFVFLSRNDVENEVNFSIMRLLLVLCAIRGEHPHRLTAVLPCLEYARQDRRVVAGESIVPKLLLRCMQTAGVDRFLTVDLHNQAEAAFSPAGAVLDELSADKYLADFIRNNVSGFDEDRVLVCATNGGGMKFTRHMADELRTGFMMAERFRPTGGGPGQIKLITDSSSDGIEGIVIVDDMFDTCGSLATVCEALQRFAPQAKVYAVATHGYFSGEAHLNIKKLVDTCGLEWLAVTNSIDQRGAIRRFASVGLHDRLKVVDISRLLAGAIIRIHLGQSVNLPRFKSLCPSSGDPVLAEAALVPQRQYTHLAGLGDVNPRPVLWD